LEGILGKRKEKRRGSSDRSFRKEKTSRRCVINDEIKKGKPQLRGKEEIIICQNPGAKGIRDRFRKNFIDAKHHQFWPEEEGEVVFSVKVSARSGGLED